MDLDAYRFGRSRSIVVVSAEKTVRSLPLALFMSHLLDSCMRPGFLAEPVALYTIAGLLLVLLALIFGPTARFVPKPTRRDLGITYLLVFWV